MKECRFCQIAQGKVEDYIIYEDNKFIAFLDANPAKQGHCLLIPKEHVDYFFDMDKELYSNLFNVAKKISEPLKSATNAKRIGIAVVGFDIPHAHLHLIPLHGSNELFDAKLFKKAEPEELKMIQQNIKQEILEHENKRNQS